MDVNDLMLFADVWLTSVPVNSVYNLSHEGDVGGVINFNDFAIYSAGWFMGREYRYPLP